MYTTKWADPGFWKGGEGGPTYMLNTKMTCICEHTRDHRDIIPKISESNAIYTLPPAAP